MPPLVSFSATRFAPRLVRVNTSARSTSSARRSSASSVALAGVLHVVEPLLDLLDRGRGRASRRPCSDSRAGRWPAPGSAPASWPRRAASAACFGSCATIRRTSGMKPRSSMWSASSSTSTSTASSLASRRPIRSTRRPGQATSTSTPRASALICGCSPTPPWTSAIGEREARVRRSGSSRRPAPRARGWARAPDTGRCWRRAGRPAPARCCRIGSANAAVLPVPVRAQPSRSWPSSSARNGLRLDRRRLGVARVVHGTLEGGKQS